MKDLANAIKFIAYIVTKVNAMKRTRFWGLVFLAFSAILIPNIDKVAAALQLLLQV